MAGPGSSHGTRTAISPARRAPATFAGMSSRNTICPDRQAKLLGRPAERQRIRLHHPGQAGVDDDVEQLQVLLLVHPVRSVEIGHVVGQRAERQPGRLGVGHQVHHLGPQPVLLRQLEHPVDHGPGVPRLADRRAQLRGPLCPVLPFGDLVAQHLLPQLVPLGCDPADPLEHRPHRGLPLGEPPGQVDPGGVHRPADVEQQPARRVSGWRHNRAQRRGTRPARAGPRRSPGARRSRRGSR